ncbi:hypothetical protein COCNU_09G003000 [Cocos nucifera]|uniref:DUF7610 domain-containing protein n=1 Tax=Cocos nucifera TaxID=13894 RepID=A0A8K0IJG5_COCNU|nr:hypothetical protein COCNU_09G003000 [Cocos nucifera]
MARGNAAMQKKLAELESEIGRLLDQPSSYINDDIDGRVGSYQTARKISFVKNLLTAEMDSHTGGRPEHLNHMAMRLSVLEKTFVNWVASGNGNGAVNKSSDTSASCSCTQSCIVDEEFVEEDNVNEETKEFGALDAETILSEESKEEGIEIEEENRRNQEEEKEGEREIEVKMNEKRRDRQKRDMVGEGTVEVTEDKEEGRERIQGGKVRESKVEVNEDEEAGEQQQQEAKMVEERKAVEKEVKVEAIEGKRGWKQEGEMVGERKFEAEQDKGSERKEGAELEKDEKETERNQERWMVGESMVEVIDDKQEGRKEEGEMVGMQKIEVKEDEKGRERKQQSCKAKNCMAMGFATAAGFAIALIGVAVANAFWVEETVYFVPT